MASSKEGIKYTPTDTQWRALFSELCEPHSKDIFNSSGFSVFTGRLKRGDYPTRGRSPSQSFWEDVEQHLEEFLSMDILDLPLYLGDGRSAVRIIARWRLAHGF